MRQLPLLPLLLLSACGVSGSHGGKMDLATHGMFGDDLAMNGGGGDGATDPCTEKARLIYVIDENATLSSFEPLTLKFTDIGKLNCAGEIMGSTNSMAIDRDAFAWVNFQSGTVYKVDTTTLKCDPTTFQGTPNGFSTFGMGFSANDIGVQDETLFIAGAYGFGSNKLGTLDTTTLKTANRGDLPSWPELTGTGDAKLYGFFPDPQNARVAEIDKTSAQLGNTYPLPQLAGTPEAWAFAFWGGDFWIFLKRDTDASTHVWHLAIFDGGTSVTDAIPNTGRKIVGAGVSICAPVTIG
jgi:hypothetical protein